MSRGRKPLGKLIVFEGPDGVGKSTLSARTAEILKTSGIACELLTFPGKEQGTLGKLIYQVHHRPEELGVLNLTASSMQALHIAAHIDAIECRIKPLLKSGKNVILDRFWWSTWVYGLTDGMDRHVLTKLIAVERQFWGTLRPATAFLVKRPAPINRDERLERWQTLMTEYELLASRERKRYRVDVIVNDGTLDSSLAEILRVLDEMLLLKRAVSSDTISTSPTILQTNGSTVNKDSVGCVKLNHLLPVKPTIVFDTYWRFAAERQAIFFRRLNGSKCPWTDDPILTSYKFTNTYRASDRVSQYLIRNVIYRDDLPSTPTEVFFRIILFKFFNKIETWQELERELGPITFSDFTFEKYDHALSRAMSAGRRIYSAAYIMPTGGRGATETRKHRLHLRLAERMIKDELPKKLVDAKSMHHCFDLLLSYPTIGDFLAYQYATDVNYSEITNFSEMSFVVPGPGALDGMRKCFSDRGGLSDPELIRLMADIQESEFSRLGLKFESLWGRPLQLIDCQNLFCEVDKYSRVKHPDISGVTGRTRIKQKFAPDTGKIEFWYPPKWKLNHLIAKPASAIEPARDLFGKVI